MKTIGLLMMGLIILSGCKGSGGDSTSPSVTPVLGFNMSGTYLLSGIECYSPSFVLTASTNFTSGSAVANWIINGNSMGAKSISSSCTITTNLQLQFTETSTGSATGSVSLKNKLYTTSNGGTCAQSVTFSSSGFSVSSLNISYTNNSSPSDTVATYVRSITTGNFGLLTTIQDSANSTSSCYLVYVKQ